jgi:hypothetical protein
LKRWEEIISMGEQLEDSIVKYQLAIVHSSTVATKFNAKKELRFLENTTRKHLQATP